MRAARSFPIPGIARSCASSSRATASGQAAIVSLADRYARILNAFSPLISSRSATSPSTCAMARLSTHQPVLLEGVVENRGAAGGKGFGDVAAPLRRAVAEHAAAASGAADLGGRGPGLRGSRDQLLDRRRGDPGRQSLAVLPFLGNGGADTVPILRSQRLAHLRSRITDPLEAVENVPVAVEVLLRDLPVIGAGVSRFARVTEDQTALQLLRIDAEGHAPYTVHLEFQRRDSAV